MSTLPQSGSLKHTSEQVLEFDSFRDILRSYTSSQLGQSRVARLAPTTDRQWIERQQQLTAEIRTYYRSGGRFEFGGLADPGKLLDKARIIGAALETQELRDILLVVDKA